MGDIINLRTARKRRGKAVEAKQAGKNRVLHGMSKAEKMRLRDEKQKLDTRISAHRIERDADKGDDG